MVEDNAAIAVGNHWATPAATLTASSVSPATLANTPIVETIASLAENPVNEEATDCQLPNPRGAKIGDPEDAVNVAAGVAKWFPTGMAALSFLIFNLLDSPCLAAISTMASELNDRKWFWFAIVFQNVYAYCISLMVYQIGSLVL